MCKQLFWLCWVSLGKLLGLSDHASQPWGIPCSATLRPWMQAECVAKWKAPRPLCLPLAPCTQVCLPAPIFAGSVHTAQVALYGTPELAPNSRKSTTPPTRSVGRKPYGSDIRTLGLVLPQDNTSWKFLCLELISQTPCSNRFQLSFQNVFIYWKG